LADLRVLDLARGVAGSYCGRLFADFGADVVKVEPPYGSPLRLRMQANASVPGPLFLWVDANKRGLTLDLDRAADLDILGRLADAADVLIEDFDASERGDDTLVPLLMRSNPRLVAVSVTDFGLSGPDRARRGSTLTLNALAGFSELNATEPGGRPHPEPSEHVYTQAGVAAYFTATAALFARERTGRGQRADISVLEVGVAVLSPMLVRHFMGLPQPRHGETLVPCKDGWVFLYPMSELSWEAVRIVFALHEYADDARFANGPLRAQNAAVIRALAQPAALTLTRREIFEQLGLLRSVCGMVLAPDEVLDDPHLAERCYFRKLAADPWGDVTYPGPPFRSDAAPWTLVLPAPSLGEHRDAVLRDWTTRTAAQEASR